MLTRLPNLAWRDRADLVALIALLGNGTKTRLVGGAVRDGLLGLPVSDIDLATTLHPGQVIDQLTAANVKAVPTGLAHGTVTAVLPNGPVEITTLRRDIATDGRRAIVAFTEDWREDAARRDFTINALYADAQSGEVFDWFEGLVDLTAHRVRFIGDPLTRIAEDHLRILRFFRFHARFGRGAPDAAAIAACTARALDLMALSRERIAAELLKLLATADPGPALAKMLVCHILASVLPEIDHNGAARLNRLIRTEAALDVLIDPVRRLAALLPNDAAVADTIVVRLKLSRMVRRRIALAKGDEPFAQSRIYAFIFRHGKQATTDRLLLSDGDIGEVADALARVQAWAIPRLSIKGGDLVARGLSKGPDVSRTLATIETRWIDAGFPTGPDLAHIVDEVLNGVR